MTGDDLYVVLCDCGGNSREVAYIDDERGNGGSVHLHPNVHQSAPDAGVQFRGTSTVANRLGDPNQAVALRCAGCGATVTALTNARVADIVDALSALREKLERRPSRPWVEPAPGHEDNYRQALLAAPAPWDHGYEPGGDAGWSLEGIPTITHYEDRVVVPFALLRTLNTKLPKRRC